MSYITNSPFRTTEDAVRSVATPERTKTWDPVPHSFVIDTVAELVEEAGLEVVESNFSMKDGKLDKKTIAGANMFGELFLESKADREYRRVVGVRNSICQDFQVGICGGEQVTICDNMSIYGAFMYHHKHTAQVRDKMPPMLREAIGNFLISAEKRAEQIEHWKTIEIDQRMADHLIMEGRRRGALIASKMMPVLDEFYEPRHDEFKDPTVWSFNNAYTEIAKTRQCDPNQIANEGLIMTNLLAEQFPVLN